MTPDDPRHGTMTGYHSQGCRCRPCTDAWAVYHHERASRPRSLTPDDPRHGTATGYIYWHCRCTECAEANSAKVRRSRQRNQRNAARAERVA